jgi:hypothetical protein
MGDDLELPDQRELEAQKHARFYRPFARSHEIVVSGTKGYEVNGYFFSYYIRPRVLRGKPGGKKVFRTEGERGITYVGVPKPYVLRKWYRSYAINYGREMTRVLHHLGVGQRMVRSFWCWESTVTRIA